MRFNFGKREKKVIGGILTILFIAGLHLMVFSRKAKEYDKVVEDWTKAKSDVQKLVGQAKNPRWVNDYEKMNEKYKRDFEEILKKLRIDFPGIYMDQSEEAIEKRREITMNHIENLLSLKDSLKNTQLTFLEKGGWNLPMELPENIQKRPERLWDVISQIHGISRILKVIDNPAVKQEKLRQYGGLLKEIGLDEQKIQGLRKYGKYIPFINRLCHYRLIVKEKPDDIELTDQEIIELLRIEFPDNYLFKLNPQLFALNDLIQMADKNEIEEITQVNLDDFTKMFAPPKLGEEQTEQEQQRPAPPMGMPMEPGMERMEPGMMPMGPEGMRFGGRMAMMGRRVQPQQPTGPPKNFLGHGGPLLMRFSGSNLNVSNYLYGLSHVPRTYELDSLIINTILDREGVEDVYAWINIVILVEGLNIDLDKLWKEKEEKKEARK